MDSLVDLKQLNLGYQLMEPLEDVDSLEAWNRYQKKAKKSNLGETE